MNSMITNVIYIEITISMNGLLCRKIWEVTDIDVKVLLKWYITCYILLLRKVTMFLSYLISNILRNLVTKQLVTLMSVYNSYTCCY